MPARGGGFPSKASAKDSCAFAQFERVEEALAAFANEEEAAKMLGESVAVRGCP